MKKNLNDVLPFKGVMYSKPKLKQEIGLCLCQPYDVITPEQQEAYYNQHENNFVRLVLNKIYETDDESNNRYTRSANLLKKWLKEKILIRSEKKGFYVYEQEFELPSVGKKKVKGFIAKIRLHDYDQGSVLPHEKILDKPLKDRYQLNDSLKMQTEYIWGLYQDKTYTIDNILDQIEKDEPMIDFFENDIEVNHKLWQLTNEQECNIITRELRNKKIYIADGHHRYQTMINYRNEMRKRHPHAGPDAPWEFISMFLVNTEHQGLTILPTHRLLYGLGLPDQNTLIDAIQEHFHLKPYPFNDDNEADQRKEFFRSLNNIAENEHAFGLYLKNMNKYFILTLKNSKSYEKLVTIDASSDWKKLDVNILNILLINHIFGVSEQQLAQQTNLDYVKDSDTAIEKVNEDKYQAALILNATKFDQVMRIADKGEKMPRKSTYFYPKPISGLVMYPMEI